MDVKGIIKDFGDNIEIKTELPFLDKEYFEKNIKGKAYTKLKENNEEYWAIKNNGEYIIDKFKGIDKLVEDLKKESVLDPLTKCYNKKGIELLTEKFLEEFLRYGFPLSVMMLDIDFFKKVNDKYGHLAGDYVLKEVANIIKNTIRKSDFCGRFGGEEFIIVLPNTKLSGAMRLAERIRENIQNHQFIFNNQKINITISIGITTASKSDSLFSLIQRADEALYEAKNKGRNRVEYR